MQIALLALTFAGIVFGFILAKWHGELMAQLRDRHRPTWEKLGSPHTAWGGWTWRTLRFLLSRRFEHLGDPPFSAAASRFRWGFLLWVGVPVAVLALFGTFYPGHTP